jgi:hypothetical protein
MFTNLKEDKIYRKKCKEFYLNFCLFTSIILLLNFINVIFLKNDIYGVACLFETILMFVLIVKSSLYDDEPAELKGYYATMGRTCMM